ncbi:hypothetical protein DMP15_20520 [Pseudonocardia sp. UM4_GMWB1]|uniref:hypothetical protein n=1 Tax=Pseudonocardia sp. UM4_GMWB1 TaxID=2212989 RepID=UPI00307F90A6
MSRVWFDPAPGPWSRRPGRFGALHRVAATVSGLVLCVVGVLVLPTSWNILAFGTSNVVFSLVSGALLLVLGAWGRFTGGLPPGNPYRRERRPGEDRDGVTGTGATGRGEDRTAGRRRTRLGDDG